MQAVVIGDRNPIADAVKIKCRSCMSAGVPTRPANRSYAALTSRSRASRTLIKLKRRYQGRGGRGSDEGKIAGDLQIARSISRLNAIMVGRVGGQARQVDRVAGHEARVKRTGTA